MHDFDPARRQCRNCGMPEIATAERETTCVANEKIRHAFERRDIIERSKQVQRQMRGIEG